MNEPKPEYGYHFVSQDDLQPGDEHWNTNAWELCAMEQGRHHCTRRRLILPPEGMRILEVDDLLTGEFSITFDGVKWEHRHTLGRYSLASYQGQLKKDFLAIAAPIGEETHDGTNTVRPENMPTFNAPQPSPEITQSKSKGAKYCLPDEQPNGTHWMPCNPPFGRPPLPEKDKPEWESWLDTWMNDRHPFPSPGYQVEYNVSMEAVKAALLAAKRRPSILDSVKEEK